MHKTVNPALTLAGLLLLFTGFAGAEETGTEPASSGIIELESRVTGNREQPQVFYVVPWQSPESPRLDYDPLSSQLEQVFGHLEREELKRELEQRSEAAQVQETP